MTCPLPGKACSCSLPPPPHTHCTLQAQDARALDDARGAHNNRPQVATPHPLSLTPTLCVRSAHCHSRPLYLTPTPTHMQCSHLLFLRFGRSPYVPDSDIFYGSPIHVLITEHVRQLNLR